MTDINKQIEEALRSKIKNCKNSTTIFDTRDYVLIDDAIGIVSSFIDSSRWRKVSEELPQVNEEHYRILTKSDDNRLDVVSILNGYDKDVVKFLLKNYIEWKPID